MHTLRTLLVVLALMLAIPCALHATPDIAAAPEPPSLPEFDAASARAIDGDGGDDSPVNGIFYAVATGATEVTLRWDLETLEGVEGFVISRALSSEGPFEHITDDALAPASPGMHIDDTVWPESTFWYRLGAMMWDGTEDICGQGIVSASTAGTLAIHFARPRPSPFTESTTFSFEIPHGVDRTTLKVYDASGRLVRTLIDDPIAGGCHDVIWNGRNDRGGEVAAGVYFVRFDCDAIPRVRKIVVVR